MLEGLFGNSTVEKVFFALYAYGEGYPLGMAKLFGVPVNSIQQQLKRLENSGKKWLAAIKKVGLDKFGDIFLHANRNNDYLPNPCEFVQRGERTEELWKQYAHAEQEFVLTFYENNFHLFHPESVAEAMADLTGIDIPKETVAEIEKVLN